MLVRSPKPSFQELRLKAKAKAIAGKQAAWPRPEGAVIVEHQDRVFVIYRDKRRRIYHYIEGVTGRVYDTTDVVLTAMVERDYESEAFKLATKLNEAMRRV